MKQHSYENLTQSSMGKTKQLSQGKMNQTSLGQLRQSSQGRLPQPSPGKPRPLSQGRPSQAPPGQSKNILQGRLPHLPVKQKRLSHGKAPLISPKKGELGIQSARRSLPVDEQNGEKIIEGIPQSGIERLDINQQKFSDLDGVAKNCELQLSHLKDHLTSLEIKAEMLEQRLCDAFDREESLRVRIKELEGLNTLGEQNKNE